MLRSHQRWQARWSAVPPTSLAVKFLSWKKAPKELHSTVLPLLFHLLTSPGSKGDRRWPKEVNLSSPTLCTGLKRENKCWLGNRIIIRNTRFLFQGFSRRLYLPGFQRPRNRGDHNDLLCHLSPILHCHTLGWGCWPSAEVFGRCKPWGSEFLSEACQ